MFVRRTLIAALLLFAGAACQATLQPAAEPQPASEVVPQVTLQPQEVPQVTLQPQQVPQVSLQAAPQAAPQEAVPPQAAPPKDSGSIPGLVPAGEAMSGASIPDIQAHRGRPVPFVRHAADVVEVHMPALDLEAAVVLEVDGRPISRAEFRRRALMVAAVNETDRFVTKILTDMEMERCAAAGEVRDFSVDDAEVEQRLEDFKNMIRAQAKGQMVPDESITASDDPDDPGERAVREYIDSINASIGMEQYQRLLAGDALFEKAYLPFPAEKVPGEAWDFTKGPPPLDEPRPEWLPQSTWDAMGRNEQGRNLRSFIKQWAINGEDIPAMFKPSILGMIRDGLVANVGVSMFFDKTLDDAVFMQVGERVVVTDEVWPVMANRLTDADIDLVVRELLTLEALKRGLMAATATTFTMEYVDELGHVVGLAPADTAAGAEAVVDGTPVKAVRRETSQSAWLSDDAVKEAWVAHEGQYANSFIPLKTIIQLRGYTSVERYREHFRYRESFSRWKKAQLTDEQVLEHYQGGGRVFFERGNVVVDVAFLPLGKRPFTDASFDALEAELGAALGAARAESAEGEDWFAKVMARYPGPAARAPSDGHTFQRNQLSMQLAESELSLLLTGYSKTAEVFYLANKGEVVGPWAERCRHHAWGAEQNAGAWAVRVRDFTRRGPLATFEGRNRDLAYEDWCDLAYFHFGQEGLKALLPKVKVPG